MAWIILCRVSGGVTGTREAPLKRACGECNGSGELDRLGGDWGKTPDTRVKCWKCDGTKREIAHFPTREIAQLESDRLSKQANGPHATASFRYSPEEAN